MIWGLILTSFRQAGFEKGDEGLSDTKKKPFLYMGALLLLLLHFWMQFQSGQDIYL